MTENTIAIPHQRGCACPRCAGDGFHLPPCGTPNIEQLAHVIAPYSVRTLDDLQAEVLLAKVRLGLAQAVEAERSARIAALIEHSIERAS